jgi:multicomponent Na+:H+ antiporter subunit D
MLLAMGFTAAISMYIGISPDFLYSLLPYEVEFHPYTASHVIGQLQLLFFALLAFGVLMRTGIHPPEIRAVNLDTDWTYRRLLPNIIGTVARTVSKVWSANGAFWHRSVSAVISRLHSSHGPEGRMAQVWPTGSMVLWIAILLGITLIVNFVS